tara:strand:+ start:38393 stop:38995 length:603 start_codon:yes stop_codon:yes gene_type:complete
MTFDLMDEHAGEAYKILASLVTPRPIAWVTTVNAEGVVNAAPFSFFNVFGSNPPLVAFAPGNREPGVPKDTALNIRERGEFVINLVDEPVAEAMNATAASLPHDQSELENSGLNLLAGESVRVPRIAECPAALECKKHSILEIGGNRLVIGIVQRVHVRDGIFDPESHRLDPNSYRPIGRMASPHWYCRTEELFEMKRPD